MTYDIELPIGTTVVPTVVGTPQESGPASAVTANAGSLPGTSTVLVTAQDGTTTETYTLNFTGDIENIALNKTGTASSLEATYDVPGVLLSWNSAGAYGVDYTIEVSSVALSWTTVHTETGNSYLTNDISFTSIEAKYVRMNGSKKSSVYGFSLKEFEVYGSLNQTIGTNSIEVSNYTVYPNPASDIIQIKGSATIGNAELYDIIGKRLLKTHSNIIDLSIYKNGIYFLKITENGKENTTKIIKK